MTPATHAKTVFSGNVFRKKEPVYATSFQVNNDVTKCTDVRKHIQDDTSVSRSRQKPRYANIKRSHSVHKTQNLLSPDLRLSCFSNEFSNSNFMTDNNNNNNFSVKKGISDRLQGVPIEHFKTDNEAKSVIQKGYVNQIKEKLGDELRHITSRSSKPDKDKSSNKNDTSCNTDYKCYIKEAIADYAGNSTFGSSSSIASRELQSLHVFDNCLKIDEDIEMQVECFDGDFTRNNECGKNSLNSGQIITYLAKNDDKDDGNILLRNNQSQFNRNDNLEKERIYDDGNNANNDNNKDSSSKGKHREKCDIQSGRYTVKGSIKEKSAALLEHYKCTLEKKEKIAKVMQKDDINNNKSKFECKGKTLTNGFEHDYIPMESNTDFTQNHNTNSSTDTSEIKEQNLNLSNKKIKSEENDEFTLEKSKTDISSNINISATRLKRMQSKSDGGEKSKENIQRNGLPTQNYDVLGDHTEGGRSLRQAMKQRKRINKDELFREKSDQLPVNSNVSDAKTAVGSQCVELMENEAYNGKEQEVDDSEFVIKHHAEQKPVTQTSSESNQIIDILHTMMNNSRDGGKESSSLPSTEPQPINNSKCVHNNVDISEEIVKKCFPENKNYFKPDSCTQLCQVEPKSYFPNMQHFPEVRSPNVSRDFSVYLHGDGISREGFQYRTLKNNIHRDKDSDSSINFYNSKCSVKSAVEGSRRSKYISIVPVRYLQNDRVVSNNAIIYLKPSRIVRRPEKRQFDEVSEAQSSVTSRQSESHSRKSNVSVILVQPNIPSHPAAWPRDRFQNLDNANYERNKLNHDEHERVYINKTEIFAHKKLY